MDPQDWKVLFTPRVQTIPIHVGLQNLDVATSIKLRQASMADLNESKVGMLYAVTLTFWTLALLTVCLRIYSRSFMSKFRGQDDWWMLGASIFAAGDQAIKLIWLSTGLGQHVAVVPIDQLKLFVKMAYVIAVLYPWSLGLVKISILCFYLRLFPHEKFRKWCYFMMGVVGVVTVSVSLAQIFACTPISASWALQTPEGAKCADRQALQYAGSIINLVTDLIILLMPMKYFLKLSGDRRKRYIVVVLFSLGLITCIASALRLQTIHAFYQGTDPTWDATDIAIWSCIEINLTIITASIPAIKPFFVKYIYRPVQRKLGITVDESVDDTKGSELSTDLSRYYTHQSNLEAGNGSNKPQIRRGSSYPALEDWGDDSDEENNGAGERNLDFYSILQQAPPTPGVKNVDLNPLNNPAAFRNPPPKILLTKYDGKSSEIMTRELRGESISSDASTSS